MKISFVVRLKLFRVAHELGEAAVARCTAGIRIAEYGKSEQVNATTVIVRAPDKADRKIEKGTPCPCDDAKYNKPPEGKCKHVWAANAFVLASKENAKQTTAEYIA